MNPKRLTVQANIDPITGYGQHAIAISERLNELGYWVSIRPMRVNDTTENPVPRWVKSRFVQCPQPEPLEILISAPQATPTPGKKTAWWTMWETSLPTLQWAEGFNKADIVIVPSSWNRDSYFERGGRKPIFVVPLGIKESESKYTPPRHNGPCIFGAAGKLAHGAERKGIPEVIRAFQTAFYRNLDVRLVIKLDATDQMPDNQDPRISIIRENWRRDQVTRFLQSITCFVSMAKGEGWGLWQHHTMACGRPLVCSVYGGIREYANASICYPVEYEITPVKGSFPGTGDWASPKLDSAVHQMRRVYLDRIEADRIGRIAQRSVAHLTWNNSTTKLIEALEISKLL